MNEQDEIFAAGDQAIRAGLMALGQTGQTIAQHSAERQRRQKEGAEVAARAADRERTELERSAREQARVLEQQQRDQQRAAADQQRSMERAQAGSDRELDKAIQVSHQQVNRDAWWANADGNRVATQYSFVDAASSDPRAADARDIMHGRMRDLYGVDVAAIEAKHPTSVIDRHNALANAVDDWRGAQREDAIADDERSAAADQRRAADVDLEATERGEELSDSAEEHEATADELRADAKTDEQLAGQYAADSQQDYAAGVAAVKEAKTPGAKARAESATGYPKSAKQSLNDGRRKGAPRARVNRSRQVQTGPELSR